MALILRILYELKKSFQFFFHYSTKKVPVMNIQVSDFNGLIINYIINVNNCKLIYIIMDFINFVKRPFGEWRKRFVLAEHPLVILFKPETVQRLEIF